MRTKSPITSLFQRLALFSAFLAACFAENATAQSRPFVNISSRAQVLNGQKVIVAGFIIQTTATTTKQVLIRGMGPSTGIPGYLADPTLTLHGPNGLIHSNNNWGDTQYSQIAATGMQPGNGNESAILWTLPAGSYTVTLSSNNGATGIGMVEVYDMGGAPPMVNLSSRAWVGTGDNVQIGGVYVLDTTRAVVRAIGPTLANFGIQEPLANPMLELYNSQGAQIASNDNWGSDPQWPEIQRLGLQPGNGYESAILPTLAPGPYTAIVKGVNNGTGIGMVELYALADAKYPRIFQAWSDADPINNEDVNVTRARHDLLIHVDFAFGYNWVDVNGQTTQDYTSETISQNGFVHVSIPTLRSLNPNMKIIVQVAYYDMADGRLPANHAWWKRDGNGNRVPSFGSAYLLDHHNPGLQAHVANQAAALMATGQFDGIFLDVTPAGTTYLLPLVTAVRNAIGQNGLILVNPNCSQLTTAELGQINGVYMECGKIGLGSGGHPSWQTAKAALDWNEARVRAPKVNCLESYFITSRTAPSDLKRMRATTALSLTHSNGYALFGDPNDLPANDHAHNWYDPFWSNHSLGVPIGNHYNIGIADRRDFKNGSVIWNAVANGNITVTFPQVRKSLATGMISTTFTLTGVDGDIYLINY